MYRCVGLGTPRENLRTVGGGRRRLVVAWATRTAEEHDERFKFFGSGVSKLVLGLRGGGGVETNARNTRPYTITRETPKTSKEQTQRCGNIEIIQSKLTWIYIYTNMKHRNLPEHSSSA